MVILYCICKPKIKYRGGTQMNLDVNIPSWDDFSERLQKDLNYSETMLERTFYTYRSFVQTFCPAVGCDASEIVQKGIDNVSAAYRNNAISKDKLLRLRRIAYRILMYLETGKLSWKRVPMYGKNLAVPTTNPCWGCSWRMPTAGMRNPSLSGTKVSYGCSYFIVNRKIKKRGADGRNESAGFP